MQEPEKEQDLPKVTVEIKTHIKNLSIKTIFGVSMGGVGRLIRRKRFNTNNYGM